MSQTPLITYYVVTWNRVHLLKNLLRSFIACNTYDNYEWLLIDHGSTDGTIDFLEQLDSDLEFASLKGRVRVIIDDENAYRAQLASRGVELATPRRVQEAMVGHYRNMARRLANGDYLIDIADDHQFIRRCNWIEEMLGVFADRREEFGRDDIASLVFRTRRRYRILKRNNRTGPEQFTSDGVPYYVCLHKGYDDYGMISRESVELMGDYFEAGKMPDEKISEWNDPRVKLYDSVHYADYLERAKELGFKKIMMKYPYTHDLLNDLHNRPHDDLVVPLVNENRLKNAYGNVDRPVSIEAMDDLFGEIESKRIGSRVH